MKKSFPLHCIASPLSPLQPSQGAYQYCLFSEHVLFLKNEVMLAAPYIAFRTNLYLRLALFVNPDKPPLLWEILWFDYPSGTEVEPIRSHPFPWLTPKGLLCIGKEIRATDLAFYKSGGPVAESNGIGSFDADSHKFCYYRTTPSRADKPFFSNYDEFVVCHLLTYSDTVSSSRSPLPFGKVIVQASQSMNLSVTSLSVEGFRRPVGELLLFQFGSPATSLPAWPASSS